MDTDALVGGEVKLDQQAGSPVVRDEIGDGVGEPDADRLFTDEQQQHVDRIVTDRLKRERKKLGREARLEIEEEYAPRLERLKELESLDRDRRLAQMQDGQREQTLRAEAQAELDRLKAELAKRDAVIAEGRRQRAIEEIDATVKSLAPDLPPFYRQQFHAQFAGSGELDPEGLQGAVEAAKAEWHDYLQAAGLGPKPTTVGAPGNPPARPRQDEEAELEDLIARSDRGEQAAVVELMRRYGNG